MCNPMNTPLGYYNPFMHSIPESFAVMRFNYHDTNTLADKDDQKATEDALEKLLDEAEKHQAPDSIPIHIIGYSRGG